MTGHHARLLGLLGALGALAAVFIVGGVIGPSRVQAWVEPLGAWGPVVFVPLSALLGTALVPGAALAAAAGLLFGPWVGAAASVVAGTLGALLSWAISRRAGHASFEVIASGPVRTLAALSREHGLLAVIIARLAPGLPDGPVNHAFGVAGLSAFAVGVGHLIASGPRALAYAIVGANADDLTGSQALIGWGLNIATGVIGAGLLWWLMRRWNASKRAKITHEATQQ